MKPIPSLHPLKTITLIVMIAITLQGNVILLIQNSVSVKESAQKAS